MAYGGGGTRWSNSKKVTYKGDKFDSRAELKYYLLLEDLKSEGKIKKVEKQVRFSLPDMNGGKRFHYTPDFVVTTNKGYKVYLEVKGRMMPGNALRYAYWQYVYKTKLTIIPTNGPAALNTDWLKED